VPIVDEKNRQWEESGLREAVMRGNESAWRTLYDRCFESLFAFIDYRTGHCRDRTEEVVQESWLVAVRRIASFDPARSSFENWMRGIAAHVLKNHWRRWKKLEKLETVAAVAQESNPGTQLELAEQIGLALTALPERYRSVLQLKYEERLSVNEIARRWSESTKAIESLLTRARNAFRQAYSGLEKERPRSANHG